MSFGGRPDVPKANRRYFFAELKGSASPALLPYVVVMTTTNKAPRTQVKITAIEDHDGYRIKREDAWSLRGARGAKARAIQTIAAGKPGIISAGARVSPQIERVALAAAALGIPARLHTGAGAETPELACARAAGATILQHNPARLSVIRARYRADTEAHPDWAHLPYGMEHPVYLAQVAKQTKNLPDGKYRLVVPVGSGATLAGILLGGVPTGVQIIGVRVGGNPAALIDRHAPDGWADRVTMVDAEEPYGAAPATAAAPRIGTVTLDPHYEAQCLPWLRRGDILWCVGLRTAVSGEYPATASVAA